ncbi:MAG: hypothetical protein DRO13_05195 [Thermoprotei archaeon]|nr:MAG: hypothetical protein DRO13_05195 [Thermoprotei archaeon]
MTKTLIVLGDVSHVSLVIEYIAMARGEEYTIVTHSELVGPIGREIGRAKQAKHVKLVVFNYTRPEESALRLFVEASPDVVVDCDPYDKLRYLKNIVKASSMEVVECSDLR